MEKYHINKKNDLGIDPGTAASRLRKMLLFRFVQQTHQDLCYRCGLIIGSVDVFSIDHIKPWLHAENPKELFFDLDNIAFSHIKCNISVARKLNKKYFTDAEKIEALRRGWRESKRRNYTTQKRSNKYKNTGK